MMSPWVTSTQPSEGSLREGGREGGREEEEGGREGGGGGGGGREGKQASIHKLIMSLTLLFSLPIFSVFLLPVETSPRTL